MNPINNGSANPINGMSLNGASAVDDLPLLSSTYGHQSCTNNRDAHTFINTALNRGSGYVGAVAAAMRIDGLVNGTENANIGNRNSAASHSGYTSFARTLNPMPIHRRSFYEPRVNNAVPSSTLAVVFQVDTPINPTTNRRGGNSRTGGISFTPFNPPPAFSPQNHCISSPGSIPASPGSVNSLRSFGSGSSSPCLCPNCRPSNCVCHMYCNMHAQQRCPVHGDGINSSSSSDSDEGCMTLSSSISSLSSLSSLDRL